MSTVQSGNVEDMVGFIKENNIGIMAPYLVDNFDPDSLSELTVSWWNQDYEDWSLSLDPEWNGNTKAEAIDLSGDSEINGTRDINDEFYVSDDYAKENPTIVLGAFDLEKSENQEAGKNENAQENLAVQNYVNSAQCAQLNANSIVNLLA